MDVTYKLVSSPTDLNVLVDKRADYNSLHFLYTAESIKKYQYLITDRTAYQLIAFSPAGDFVGFVSSSEKDFFPDYLFLGELFIDPKYSRQGIGSSLVNRIIEKAKSEKLKGVVTETELENIPAQKLYEKSGFQRIDNPNWEGVTYRIQF